MGRPHLKKTKAKKKQGSSCCYSLILECPPHAHILCPCSPVCGGASLKAVEPLKDRSRSLGGWSSQVTPTSGSSLLSVSHGPPCEHAIVVLTDGALLPCDSNGLNSSETVSQNKYPAFKFLSSVWVGGTKIMHTVLLFDNCLMTLA